MLTFEKLLKDQNKVTGEVSPMVMKENQDINIRKATAMAILEAYAKYQIDLGKTKLEVMRSIEQQVKNTTDALYIPSKFNNKMISAILNKVYTKPTRKELLMESVINNIVEINEEDNGGEDAGLGLPDEIKKDVKTIMEYDKVIDESGDAIVKVCGNKSFESCIKEMSLYLPQDFIKTIS